VLSFTSSHYQAKLAPLQDANHTTTLRTTVSHIATALPIYGLFSTHINMADANAAPRRVSMAYILGFSNKPFKDGGPPAPPPAPRHPSAFKQMVKAHCVDMTSLY
jgi:hypothetical protein